MFENRVGTDPTGLAVHIPYNSDGEASFALAGGGYVIRNERALTTLEGQQSRNGGFSLKSGCGKFGFVCRLVPPLAEDCSLRSSFARNYLLRDLST